MPAGLPPSSGYTYAADVTADEALDADTVAFDAPVFFYVENFIGFPVGSAVPVGLYDPTAGAWVPVPNGVVLKITDVTGGVAAVDTDGDGVADDGAGLDVPLSTEELEALGRHIRWARSSGGVDDALHHGGLQLAAYRRGRPALRISLSANRQTRARRPTLTILAMRTARTSSARSRSWVRIFPWSAFRSDSTMRATGFKGAPRRTRYGSRCSGRTRCRSFPPRTGRSRRRDRRAASSRLVCRHRMQQPWETTRSCGIERTAMAASCRERNRPRSTSRMSIRGYTRRRRSAGIFRGIRQFVH